MMDTNPWGRVPYTNKGRMRHWKERAESYKMQRMSSYREQYEQYDTNLKEVGFHTRQYEKINGEPWDEFWDKNAYMRPTMTKYWEEEMIYHTNYYKRTPRKGNNEDHRRYSDYTS